MSVLVDFTAGVPVDGADEPVWIHGGCTYQPDEAPLRLPVARIAEIRDAARDAVKPGVYVHGDFIIWNGGQRLGLVLGQVFRLIAYNRAIHKRARI